MNRKFTTFIVLSSFTISIGFCQTTFKATTSDKTHPGEAPCSSSGLKSIISAEEGASFIGLQSYECSKVEYSSEITYVSSEHKDKENSKTEGLSNKALPGESGEESSSTRKASYSAPGYNWGIGLRLGDPSGFSIKKYINDNALEISIGRGYMFYGSELYDRKYEDWYEDWHKEHYYDDYDYLGHSASFPLTLQVHYLFQKDFEPVKNLQWYWGLGGQARFRSYTYEYRYKVDGNSHWFYGEERITDLDLGIDGVLGIEYHIPDLPVSVFTDLTLFTEIVDDPFLFWPQLGIGGRYNF